jgi:sugar/nucleoside kinase (ribokinase family)
MRVCLAGPTYWDQTLLVKGGVNFDNTNVVHSRTSLGGHFTVARELEVLGVGVEILTTAAARNHFLTSRADVCDWEFVIGEERLDVKATIIEDLVESQRTSFIQQGSTPVPIREMPNFKHSHFLHLAYLDAISFSDETFAAIRDKFAYVSADLSIAADVAIELLKARMLLCDFVFASTEEWEAYGFEWLNSQSSGPKGVCVHSPESIQIWERGKKGIVSIIGERIEGTAVTGAGDKLAAQTISGLLRGESFKNACSRANNDVRKGLHEDAARFRTGD